MHRTDKYCHSPLEGRQTDIYDPDRALRPPNTLGTEDRNILELAVDSNLDKGKRRQMRLGPRRLVIELLSRPRPSNEQVLGILKLVKVGYVVIDTALV